MAIDKDFIIRNGIEVSEDLLYADADADKVGIGTTTPDKKLVVIGDTEVSESLSVGTTITAQRADFTGIVTSHSGIDIGVGGTVFKTNIDTKKVGINSTIPRYTLDVIGPVSIGQTAEYIYGDLTVTGDIRGSSLSGQISAGGTVGFTNVTVERNLFANNAGLYTLFRVEEFDSNKFRFTTSGDPVSIGFTQNANNPEIYLARGQHYKFDVDSGGFPFYIKTKPTADLNDIFNDGIEGNGAQVGIVTFRVPFNAPNTLYYQASNTAGMGGTIYLTNDGKNLTVGVLTVTDFADINQGNFENIYVSGIGTINNLKGPQNFSVSAGILTVRQDQTALIGVSTGADRISIQERSDNVNYQIPFTDVLPGIPTGISSSYNLMYLDNDDAQLRYNPSTNILSVKRLVGNVSGVATGADDINIDSSNSNTNFQVTFSEPSGTEYERQLIDSQSDRFIYNPSTNRLSVTNITATTVTAGLAGTATNANFINVDEKSDNVTYQVLFSDDQGVDYQRPYIDSQSGRFTYNPSTNTLSSTNITATTVTAGLAGTATNANFINVDEKSDNVNYQVLFSDNQGVDYQRPYIDSQSGQFTYNPSTNTLTAENIAGAGDNITNLDGSNISQGLIDEARLPNASTSEQGVVQLDNNYPPTSTSTTQTTTSNVARLLYLTATNQVPAGSVMLFYQASAPTGWTKITNQNNKTLRVVSGSGGTSGGSVSFTSAFTDRTVPLPIHSHVGSTGAAGGHSHSGSTGGAGGHSHGGSVNGVGDHTHTGYTSGNGYHGHGVNDPGHSHSYDRSDKGSGTRGGDQGVHDFNRGTSTSRNGTGISINGAGNHSHSIFTYGGGAHSHSLSINGVGNHSHSVSVSSVGNHSHSVTVSDTGVSGASMDFNVQYIDVILAQKN